ncbi:unnamed protein product [Caenorhabditis angaria]|uniref:Tetratricopeptide SHNi-TPR domain-containing protein n=1 Tax=Caenorhabditis angaria TaxID=860376 RepID=A0A9P1IYH2_9PELO|nr:unnamed protein product [Caenorhabditis angaria]
MTAALADTTNTMTGETTVPVENVKTTTTEEAIPTTAETSTTVATELTAEEKATQLKNNLTSGKRLLLTSEFSKAADLLSLASQLAGELFGDDSEQSFDPYFYYGQALLELGKLEDQVFSNAMTNMPTVEEGNANNDSIDEEQYGNPDKLSEEEREQIKEQVDTALSAGAEKADGLVEPEAETEKEADAEAEAEQVEGETEEGDEEMNTEADAEAQGEATTEAAATGDVAMAEGDAEAEGEGEEEEEDEDDSSMKLAWEIFETTRRICDKKLESLAEEQLEDIKKWTLHKADVLSFLGEHGIADGKPDQAIKDLEAALELQTTHLGETSRVLAQTNHLLAKAFRMDGGFNEAAKFFSDSKKVLVAKTEELKASLENAMEESKKEIEDELKELAELIPEMDVYIDDSKASAEQAEKIKETVKEELESAAQVLKNLTSSSGDASNTEANDISGMIRRPAKRPASAQDNAEEDVAKKTKSDETSEATSTTENSA